MSHKQEELDISFKSVIVLVLILLSLGVFFTYSDYQGVVIENNEVRDILTKQDEHISLLEKEINSLRFENEGRVDELQKRLTREQKIRKAVETQRNTQDKIDQNKISDLETKLALSGSSQNLALIIKDWKPLVAYIQCDFKLPNSYLGVKTEGSGIIVKFDNTPIRVITNRHVVTGPPLYVSSGCSVKVLNSKKSFLVPFGDIEVSADEYDWGILTINNPDKNLIALTKIFPKLCEQKPALGDGVVVLGYPQIGSVSSVTATEGIIAGFDGDYFITSAKVEQGNSGGAAILSKNSCLFGIPTYASLGQVESLARILDIWTVVVKK